MYFLCRGKCNLYYTFSPQQFLAQSERLQLKSWKLVPNLKYWTFSVERQVCRVCNVLCLITIIIYVPHPHEPWNIKRIFCHFLFSSSAREGTQINLIKLWHKCRFKMKVYCSGFSWVAEKWCFELQWKKKLNNVQNVRRYVHVSHLKNLNFCLYSSV